MITMKNNPLNSAKAYLKNSNLLLHFPKNKANRFNLLKKILNLKSNSLKSNKKNRIACLSKAAPTTK